MEERVVSSRQSWESNQYEMRQRQAKVGELEANLRRYESSAAVAAQELKAFKVLRTKLATGMG